MTVAGADFETLRAAALENEDFLALGARRVVDRHQMASVAGIGEAHDIDRREAGARIARACPRGGGVAAEVQARRRGSAQRLLMTGCEWP